MSITSYAQNFEDVMLWRALGFVESGFYIDVGAQHPTIDSVSKAFYEHGWRGVHIEPTVAYAALLRRERRDETILQAALADKAGVLTLYEIPETGLSTADTAIAERHRSQGFTIEQIDVPCLTLSDLFDQIGQRDIHWMKIDVEGFERQVLEGWANHQARPWIVLLESTLPLTTDEAHASWESLMLERGYKHVYFDGLNRYYVSAAHPELQQAFRAPPNVFDSFNLAENTPFCRANSRRHETEHQQTIAQLKDTEARRASDLASAAREIADQGLRAAEREEALSQALDTANASLGQFKTTERHIRAEIERLRLERDAIEARAKADLQKQAESMADRETRFIERERTLGQTLIELQRTIRDLVADQSTFRQSAADELRQTIQHARSEHEARHEQIVAAHTTEVRMLTDAVERLNAERDAIATRARLDMDRSAKSAEAQGNAFAQREQALQAQLADARQTLDQLKVEISNTRLAAKNELEQFSQAARIKERVASRREHTLLERIEQLQAEIAALDMRRIADAEARSAVDLTVQKMSGELLSQQQLADELRKQAAVLRDDTLALLAQSNQREREFAQTLDEARQHAEARLAALVQRHDAVLASMSHQSQVRSEQTEGFIKQLLDNLRLAAEREQRLHDKLTEQAHERKEMERRLTELAQHVESERALRATLHSHLQMQVSQAGIIAAEIDRMQRSLIWRVSTPLRNLLGWHDQRSPSSYVRPPADLGIRQPDDTLPSVAPTVALEQPADTCDMSDSNSHRGQDQPPQSRTTTAMDTIEHVDQLLDMHEGAFVQAAYRALLGREPDLEGLRYYLGRLRQGYEKSDLIAQIATSPEARTNGKAELPGVSLILARKRSANRWYKRLFTGDRHAARQINRLESELGRLGRQITRLESECHLRFDQLDRASETLQAALNEYRHQSMHAFDDLRQAVAHIHVSDRLTESSSAAVPISDLRHALDTSVVSNDQTPDASMPEHPDNSRQLADMSLAAKRIYANLARAIDQSKQDGAN
ncbi:FkbM family methyltransferase [Burkholderia cenocepacia]|uniref:FkbM family methyltransferase n=1 Tax=Burkholderia cenocepacia TaxID=95486 RepID=UPI002938D8A1|nr:FkbM family methyltransferase [Burkholderia cenocepacia]MDV3096570.1 FkbM family methyltransferase [Burkholderia cenocepacia]